jgi:hypothetical protein
MIRDSEKFVKILKKSLMFFTQLCSMFAFYVTILQNQNQEIDVGTMYMYIALCFVLYNIAYILWNCQTISKYQFISNITIMSLKIRKPTLV